MSSTPVPPSDPVAPPPAHVSPHVTGQPRRRFADLPSARAAFTGIVDLDVFASVLGGKTRQAAARVESIQPWRNVAHRYFELAATSTRVPWPLVIGHCGALRLVVPRDASPPGDPSTMRITAYLTPLRLLHGNAVRNKRYNASLNGPDAPAAIKNDHAFLPMSAELLRIESAPQRTSDGSLAVSVRFDRFGPRLRALFPPGHRHRRVFARFSLVITSAGSTTATLLPLYYAQRVYTGEYVPAASPSVPLTVHTVPIDRLRRVLRSGLCVFKGSAAAPDGLPQDETMRGVRAAISRKAKRPKGVRWPRQSPTRAGKRPRSPKSISDAALPPKKRRRFV